MRNAIVWTCTLAMDETGTNTLAMARRLAIQLGAIVVYLVPSIVSQRYQHPKHTAILILNLALGWTIVGWVVALI